MASSISSLVHALIPAVYELLDSTAVLPLHMELAASFYDIDYSDEAVLSNTDRLILVYGTGLSMVVAGLDMIRTEIQKAEAGPAKVEWVDKLKAFLALRDSLQGRLNAFIGLEDTLVPPLLQKVT